jgi:hypothetical protein
MSDYGGMPSEYEDADNDDEGRESLSEPEIQEIYDDYMHRGLPAPQMQNQDGADDALPGEGDRQAKATSKPSNVNHVAQPLYLDEDAGMDPKVSAADEEGLTQSGSVSKR